MFGNEVELSLQQHLSCHLPQGPATWRWIFVMTVPLIYVDRSTAGDHEVFEDTDQDCRIWSDWKCNGPLPLEMLALSRLEKALQRLLFQLIRYSFCGICGNELEGLAPIAWGQKSLFPRWPTLLLSHILAWWHPEGTSWLFFIPLWLTISTAVRTVLRYVPRQRDDGCFP